MPKTVSQEIHHVYAQVTETLQESLLWLKKEVPPHLPAQVAHLVLHWRPWKKKRFAAAVYGWTVNSLHQEKIMLQSYFPASPISVHQDIANSSKFSNAVNVEMHRSHQYLSTTSVTRVCKADQDPRILHRAVPEPMWVILHARCSPISP